MYLHWKSCFSGERHFSAVCQSGQRSRTRTGVDPEDSSCLKEIDKKVFEYRLHLEKNLNSRDIACPFKVDYRRGKHFIMCLITFLFLSAQCLYPECMFLQDMFSNLHYPDQGGILRRRKQRIFNRNFFISQKLFIKQRIFLFSWSFLRFQRLNITPRALKMQLSRPVHASRPVHRKYLYTIQHIYAIVS